jgi:uncharacterized protein (TIGR02246 family)
MKTNRLSVFVCLPLLLLTAAACVRPGVPSNPVGDAEAIRRLGPAFDDAWLRKDPRARAALFAERATLINPFGARASGRAEIEGVFAGETQTIANGTSHHWGAMAIQFLDGDRALVDADNEIDGIRAADGKEAPPLRYHVVAVAERTEGGWRWLAGRPYAFLPPPAR